MVIVNEPQLAFLPLILFLFRSDPFQVVDILVDRASSLHRLIVSTF